MKGLAEIKAGSSGETKSRWLSAAFIRGESKAGGGGVRFAFGRFRCRQPFDDLSSLKAALQLPRGCQA
jgi:hypothetical protein